ncbi:hypothetical protein BT96DRAFT_436225 [Gymnopus androsaceus JB14]|uniref:PHD-type domain-containing protein n=1 Tax=Gymnopus androsaceus JB14 TaxID=1447944 RepID=A0A6A4GSY5_9AGAR|nr:hypothetical protein BT96DRAFT_436225 [Gymnopus androsaceus JB14]
MMNVNAIAGSSREREEGEEFFGMRRRSSISNMNTATSTKQQQQRGNSPALSTKQQQQRSPPTPSRDISAGQASGSTAVRLVNGHGHEIDGNGTLLLSPTAALEANGRRISGSGPVSVYGHGAGSAGGASGKNKSGAGRKSLAGRSASPVASTTSSGRRTAPHSSASASSSAGPSSSTIPAKRKQPPSSASPTVPSASNSNSNDDPDTIRCICGYTNDDGWSIGCDGCGRWVHGVCFGIEMKDKENLPDRWWCWECNPLLFSSSGPGGWDLDRERQKARELQARRMKIAEESGNGGTGGGRRRLTSPGVERKPRKTSGGGTSSLSINPSEAHPHSSHKRKRTFAASAASPLSATPTTATMGGFAFPNGYGKPNSPSHLLHPNAHSHLNPSPDDFIDVDEPYPEDIIPQKETRDRLQKQAAEWRGVSAIGTSPFLSTEKTNPPPPGWPYFDSTPVQLPHAPTPHPQAPISLRPLNASGPSPSTILPPTYALHTTQPLPSHSFVAPFPSVITPSSEYLKDPLNGYAVLGMPKPKVHLMGPPLDVCLDTRGTGSMGVGGMNEEFGEEGEEVKGKGKGDGRWVRSGCWPNAVLRPVLCDSAKAKRKHGKRKGKKTKKASGNRASEDEASASRSRNHGASAQSDGDVEGDSDSDSDPQALSFAIFALRDLKADEEVVLGWEWDDANVVHLLPAFVEGKGVFPPAQLASYKLQMANILRSLGATFATCACGEAVGASAFASSSASADSAGLGEGLGEEWVGMDGNGLGARGCVLRRMKEFVDGVYDSLDGNGQEKERERARVDMHELKDDPAISDARKPEPELVLSGKPEQLEPRRHPEGAVDVEMTDLDPRHRRSSSPRPVATRRLSPRPKSPAAPVPSSSAILSPSSTSASSLPLPPSSNLNSDCHPNSHSATPRTHDLGPLIGVPRGFRTRERIPGSGGWGGVEMDLEFEGALGPRPQAQPKPKEREHAESLPLPPHMFPQYLPHPSFSFGYAYPPPHAGIPDFPAPYGLPPFSFPSPFLSPFPSAHSYPYSHPYGPPPNPSPSVNQSSISRTDGNVDLYWGTRPARAAEDVDKDGEVEVDIEGDEEGDVEVDIDIEGDGDEDGK